MSDPFVFDHNRLFKEPTMEQHGSHMIIKNVQKPEKTKYLTIDTRYRDEYDRSLMANYNITLPERVNSVKSVKVLSAEIPLSYFNISSSLGNNSFNLYNKGNETNFQVTVADGVYSPTTMATAINAVLTAGTNPTWVKGGNIVIVRDATTGKMTITNGNASIIIVNFETVDCKDGSGGTSKKESLMSKLGWQLGFRKTSYTLAASGGADAAEGEAIADFSGISYLYLIVDEFKNSNPHSFLGVSRTSQISSQQILARITIDNGLQNIGIAGASIGTLSASHMVPKIMTVDGGGNLVSDTRTYGELVDIQKLNVRLVDNFGRIMNLNGLDFSFLLELKHE